MGDLETTLADWSIGSLLGLWFQSVFVGLCSHILTIAIFLVIYGRMIEVYLTVSVGPIPFATMVNREWGHTGQNYLKFLLALGFQAFLIMVCVGKLHIVFKNFSVSLYSQNYNNGNFVRDRFLSFNPFEPLRAVITARCFICTPILSI